MKSVGGAAAVAAGMVLLAGCSANDGDSQEVTTTVTETTTESPTSSATEASTSSATEATASTGALALGEKADLSAVTFTVSEVKKASSPHSQLPADQQWWSVMVEGCTKVDGVSFSWHPWSITGTDGGTYPASDSAWGDFPRPQYPFGGAKVVPNGKCVKGWMMIALNADVEPATIDYSNSQGDALSWKA